MNAEMGDTIDEMDDTIVEMRGINGRLYETNVKLHSDLNKTQDLVAHTQSQLMECIKLLAESQNNLSIAEQKLCDEKSKTLLLLAELEALRAEKKSL